LRTARPNWMRDVSSTPVRGEGRISAEKWPWRALRLLL
jgi:hypothetical protein